MVAITEGGQPYCVSNGNNNNKNNIKIDSHDKSSMRVLDDISSVARVAEVCSIVPFMTGQGEGLTVSKSGQLYNHMICLILVGTSIGFSVDVLFNARFYKIMKNKSGDTEEINQTIETLFCIVSYTMIVVSCVHNAQKHCRTFKDIAKIDEHLEAGGFSGVYKCHKISVLLFFSSMTVLGVAFYYIHFLSDIDAMRQTILLLAYGLQMAFSCVFAIYLRVVLKNIARRIEFVNSKLLEFTKDGSKENWRELSNVIEIFCKFRYIMENINGVTGVALLFYMGYAFYTVTNQSYLAFSTLTTHVLFAKKYDTMILSCVWVVSEVLTMFVICSSCDAMSSELINYAKEAMMTPKAWQAPKLNKPQNKIHIVRPVLGEGQRVFSNDFLREPIKENPLFLDIKTTLMILKGTGLLPIFEQVSNYEIGPPTKPNDFYSFFVRGVVHAFTIFHLYNLFTPGSAQIFFSYRDTDNINQWIEIVLCILTYTATVFICGRNSKSYMKIMNDILKVDEEICQKFSVTLNNNCNFSWKFLIGICICQIYIIVLRIIGQSGPLTPTSYILIGFYAIQNGLATIFIVFAAALLRVITMRFAYLNLVLTMYSYKQQSKLRNRIHRIGTDGGGYASMETFPDHSLFVYRLHNKLLRIYKTTNDCCSLILVAYMGYAFYTITTNTYNLFVQITAQNTPPSFNVVQWCFVWLVLHTSLLALLSKSCGQATREANTTSQILARVYGKSKEYQNIIDKFLTKSIKQEVQFTAYGFFVIDNSTLFKIFSAVTTYLVILIQFKQLEDSKMEDQKQQAA